MTFTKPSTASPHLILGNRNRSILKTFQSAHVHTYLYIYIYYKFTASLRQAAYSIFLFLQDFLPFIIFAFFLGGGFEIILKFSQTMHLNLNTQPVK